jgi:hypothetical protein
VSTRKFITGRREPNFGGVARASFNRDGGLSASAFGRVRPGTFLGQEVFYGAKKIRTEPASSWRNSGQSRPGQQAAEEFLGQIGRGVFIMSATPDERQDGHVVGFAIPM